MFVSQKNFWLGSSNAVQLSLKNEINEKMPEYFEHTPKSLVPGIQVHGLKKQFGEITAIDHLSVTMYKNETFCLLGKNGAGKSTLVSILTGMH